MAMILATRGRRLFIFPGAVRLSINATNRVVHARIVSNAWIGIVGWGCITSFVSAFIGAFVAQFVGIPWRGAVICIVGLVWLIVAWVFLFWWKHRSDPLLTISDELIPATPEDPRSSRHVFWNEVERIELFKKKLGYFDSSDSFRAEMAIRLHTVHSQKPIILTLTHSGDERLSDYKRVMDDFRALCAIHEATQT